MPFSFLSEREREIFDLFGQGCDIKKIAERLSISPRTVEQHRNNLKNKLGVKKSHDLVVMAVEERHKPFFASDDLEIILIEDNELEAEMIQGCFTRMKIANPVIWFSDGKTALSYIKNHKSPFSIGLIILDLILPRMSGVEILQSIKKLKQSKMTPVVALTSSNDPKDRIQVLSMGATGYISKPSSIAQLEEALSATIRFIGHCAPNSEEVEL
jgi:DNA-binding NarL/FixJ family response regulator